jgi:hypothetical protein
MPCSVTATVTVVRPSRRRRRSRKSRLLGEAVDSDALWRRALTRSEMARDVNESTMTTREAAACQPRPAVPDTVLTSQGLHQSSAPSPTLRLGRAILSPGRPGAWNPLIESLQY